MKLNWHGWQNLGSLHTKELDCGYCGKHIATQHGYHHKNLAYIFICPNCGLPTFYYGENQLPGAKIGRDISGLPDDIKKVYDEILDSSKNANYTAATLLGRKLIMHVAVEAGAKEGENFVTYVDFLADKHYIPPKSEQLLDFMRKIGNEKNHEIKLGDTKEVYKMIKFIESLLYFIYELNSEFDEDEIE